MNSVTQHHHQSSSHTMTWLILSCVWLLVCYFILSDWAQHSLHHLYETKGFRGQFSPRYAEMDFQRIMFLLYCSVPGLSWLFMSMRQE